MKMIPLPPINSSSKYITDTAMSSCREYIWENIRMSCTSIAIAEFKALQQDFGGIAVHCFGNSRKWLFQDYYFSYAQDECSSKGIGCEVK